MSGRMSGRSSRSVSFSAASAPLLSPGALDDVTDILLASTKRYEDLPDAERKPPERMKHHNRRFDVMVMIVIWVLWLFVGTVYYKQSDCCQHRWGESFYITVNIGYSIGFDHVTAVAHRDRYFSSVYLIVGYLCILMAVFYFVEMIVSNHLADQHVNVEDVIAETMQKQNNVTQLGTQHRILPTSMQQQPSKTHQSTHPMHTSSGNSNHFPSSSSSSLLGYYPEHDMYAQEDTSNQRKTMATTTEDHLPLPMLSPMPSTSQENHYNSTSVGVMAAAVSFFQMCSAWSSSLLSKLIGYSSYDAALAVSFFFIWLIVGVLWTQIAFEWQLSKALYFSLSTLTSAGLYSIPETSTDIQFALVGLYAATGIPVTMLAIGHLVTFLVEENGRRTISSYLRRKITDSEFEMLRSESMDPVTGKVDLSRLLLLVFVRQRVVDMRLIDVVLERVRQRDEGDLAD